MDDQTEQEPQLDEEQQDEAAEQDLASMPLTARLSCLLYVSTKPVTSRALARLARSRIDDVEQALEELRETVCDEVTGFSLQEINGGWQFRTAPAAAPMIQRMIPKRIRRLSRAASETLAIIAYKQPVERAEIESIRGVDALPTLKTLLDTRLVRVVGKQDAVGQPALYGTTNNFLERFGLRDLTDLPSLHELEELLEESGEPDAEPAQSDDEPEVADGEDVVDVEHVVDA